MIPSVPAYMAVPQQVYQRGLVIDSQQRGVEVSAAKRVSKGIGD